VLVEPVARNTAPAIALAALHLLHAAPGDDTVMAVLPADHHVADGPSFCRALERAAQLARQGAIVTLGIRPTAPETGFGYIQQGAEDSRVPGAFAVEQFREKPDLVQAEQFLAAGNFVWNAGIFVMQPKTFLAEVQRQLPELYTQLQPVVAAIGKPHYEDALKAAYAAIKGVSIDYGVMEKASGVAVVPASCGWSDVGSWSALGAVIPPDAHNNVVRGQAVVSDSQDCVVYAADGHMVAVAGMKGVVVVHTPDATLVLPAERAQEVKDLLETVRTRNWQKFL
jgi:mannose-1-phosphate guanylyltransferase